MSISHWNFNILTDFYSFDQTSTNWSIPTILLKLQHFDGFLPFYSNCNILMDLTFCTQVSTFSSIPTISIKFEHFDRNNFFFFFTETMTFTISKVFIWNQCSDTYTHSIGPEYNRLHQWWQQGFETNGKSLSPVHYQLEDVSLHGNHKITFQT